MYIWAIVEIPWMRARFCAEHYNAENLDKEGITASKNLIPL